MCWVHYVKYLFQISHKYKRENFYIIKLILNFASCSAISKWNQNRFLWMYRNIAILTLQPFRSLNWIFFFTISYLIFKSIIISFFCSFFYLLKKNLEHFFVLFLIFRSFLSTFYCLRNYRLWFIVFFCSTLFWVIASKFCEIRSEWKLNFSSKSIWVSWLFTSFVDDKFSLSLSWKITAKGNIWRQISHVRE